jgi:hypothetical protein
MLHYNRTILFVELKQRGGSGWLTEATTQLEITVNKFKTIHNILEYDKVEAYAANKLKPYYNKSNQNFIDKFKKDTGFVLFTQNEIFID